MPGGTGTASIRRTVDLVGSRRRILVAQVFNAIEGLQYWDRMEELSQRLRKGHVETGVRRRWLKDFGVALERAL